MSYDAADLDNDGAPEVFAVDMKPYADDEAMMAQWQSGDGYDDGYAP